MEARQWRRWRNGINNQWQCRSAISVGCVSVNNENEMK
jgi:hypothetical protein